MNGEVASPPWSAVRWLAVPMGVIGVAMLVGALFSDSAQADSVQLAVATAPAVLSAVLLLWRAPQRPATWVVTAMALEFSLWVLTPVLGLGTDGGFRYDEGLGDALLRGTWAFGLPLIPVLLLVFPDPPRHRAGRALLGLQLVAVAALFAVMATGADERGPAWLFIPSQVLGIALILSAIPAVARLGMMRRRSTGPERTQVTLVLASGLVLVGLYVVMPVVGALLGMQGGGDDPLALIISLVPLSVAIALLGYGLYGIETAINRVLTALVLVGLLVGSAVLAATAARRLLDVPADSPVLSVVAALTVLALARPVLRLSRRTADVVMPVSGGDRRALAAVAGRLDQAAAVSDLPAEIAAELGGLFGFDAVAVRAIDEDETRVLAIWGSPAGPSRTLDLRYGGQPIGALEVWPVPATRDWQSLEGLGPHVAAAIEVGRLGRELARSQEHLVWSREEERRRLRRDLHDELSPALAGMRLAVAAARRRLGGSDAEADELLGRVQDESAVAVDTVRRILDGLRPPALEQQGLAGVLAERADALNATQPIRVEVDCRAPQELPPAIELAAYRIATEAMTNAVRHSGGSRCTVSVEPRADDLAVEVHDDGVGRLPEQTQGVGLLSMRERAEAIGGRLSVQANAGRGTTVTALLPCGAAS